VLRYDTTSVGWRLPRRRKEMNFLLLGAFRAEGPLHLNSREEPLWHEARAEGLSTPALTAPAVHTGGLGFSCGTSAGGKGSPTAV
jgi:hypothetical protein